MNYDQFIDSKRITVQPSGFEIMPDVINDMLFDFQNDIVRWALNRGKAAIFADCGLGKGQPYGSKVLTVDGWSNIEDLEPGVMVISSDGSSYPVTGVYPKGELDTYKFNFSDGVSFVVDEDHLHIVRTNNDRQRGNPWRVMSTTEMLSVDNIRYGENGKSRNYDIPVVVPCVFESQKQEIHPYVIGCLLGDGYLKGNISISNADNDLINRFDELLPDGVFLQQKSKYDWIIKTGLTGTKKHPFRQALEYMGLLGKTSKDKFIPNEYLLGSVEERTELLRGLMDTDGYIKDTSQFYTVSHDLADDVMFLIRSLGGIPTRSIKNPTFTDSNGEKKNGKKCHVITFSLKGINPFWISRKADLWNPEPRDNGRWIDSIEYEGKQKTVCISVGSPDSSYVTENFIVTHNTPMQLEWAYHVHRHTGGNVLIMAPLAVSQQTAREGQKFGIDVNIARTAEDIRPGINITNYERMHMFDPAEFTGIVLDESSILKAQFGKRRHEITDFGRNIPYRLAASATPAPNDLTELVNHAEFFGIMSESEIKALFFTQDGNSSNKFRLKRHATDDFWKWMASWSVALRKPADLGYAEDCTFELPPLTNHQIVVDVDRFDNNMLFAVEAVTLTEQRIARNASLDQRVEVTAEMVNASDEPWLVWCDLNAESKALAKAIPDAIEVTGSDSAEKKEDAMLGFSDGRYRVIVTKPSIAGFGMNWQHCNKVAFVGLSHSYEKYYQAVRRVWRFGQQRPVDVYIVTSIADGAVVSNIERKEKLAMEMYENIVHHMSVETDLGNTEHMEAEYVEDVASGEDWTVYLGDSVNTIDNIEDDSIGLTVFSPPFPGMYVYTNSPHDMGNVGSIDQMVDQFAFLMGKEKLLRATMPGRNTFIHITQGVAQKGRDGYIGIKDFRGKIIEMMTEIGWIYYGEITIDKDPQLKAMRTKDHGLMFKSLVSDSARMHPALSDMLLQFRKPGDNPEPIRAGNTDKYESNGWVSSEEWINWARPVWYAADYEPGTWRPDNTGEPCPTGIRETDVLNVRQARDTNDERHLCPLQIGVIERVVKVWSAPGDLVYSPFTGIGSEGVTAIKNGRRFVGGELKQSYWRSAVRNLQDAEREVNTPTLFDMMDFNES